MRLFWAPLFLLLALAWRPAFGLSPNSSVCVGCRADLNAIRVSYSADEWQMLMQGSTVISLTRESQGDGAVQSIIEISALIDFQAPAVWDVVTDFEARPRYVPGVKDVRIVRTEGNRIWVAQYLRVLLADIRYEAIDTLDPENGVVSWTLDKSVDHDIVDSRGSWQVIPLTAQASLLKYRAWVDTGRPVPQFIEDLFTKRSLPAMIQGVRGEVQRRVSPAYVLQQHD